MEAIVVYESMWGNTAEVARAIAEGIGADVRALTTSEASGEVVAGADLIVAGAPLVGFTLATDEARKSIEKDPKHRRNPPDLSQPSMRSWLAALPRRSGLGAAFETRFKRSPGSSAKRVRKALAAAGYRAVVEPERFVVLGVYGPLREGEVERARRWGAAVAEAAAQAAKDG